MKNERLRVRIEDVERIEGIGKRQAARTLAYIKQELGIKKVMLPHLAKHYNIDSEELRQYMT